MYYTTDKCIEMDRLLRKSLPYIKRCHDDAENKHDSYGEDYMDSVQYEIMENTSKLINSIDDILSENKDT